MLKRKPSVLDEREMLELYRVEHFGLWLMYALLCAAILIQLLLGAALSQMAGELAVVIIASAALVVLNVRHGIWDTNSRPSVRDNAAYSLGAGLCVAAVLWFVKGNAAAALGVGLCTAALLFAVLTLLMRYMMKKQAQQEKELDNE